MIKAPVRPIRVALLMATAILLLSMLLPWSSFSTVSSIGQASGINLFTAGYGVFVLVSVLRNQIRLALIGAALNIVWMVLLTFAVVGAQIPHAVGTEAQQTASAGLWIGWLASLALVAGLLRATA